MEKSDSANHAKDRTNLPSPTETPVGQPLELSTKQTKRQSSGIQREDLSLPGAQEKCFAMSRAAALGATGGGGEPPSAASHVSETLIQDLPERRTPRVTAAQCTEQMD